MANHLLRSSDQPVYASTEGVDSHLNIYLHSLVGTLQTELKGDLLAVYLFGSAGYGAYEPGISDVDVYAIVNESVLDLPKLSRTISHAAIPCPARKLELVLFTRANAAKQTAHPVFEMNFNTGRNMHEYLNLNALTEPRFWFLLDIAIGRDLGKSLLGPPPHTLFPAPKREWIFDCMFESLAWQRRNGPISCDGILNACREVSYAKTFRWVSKLDGGAWMLENYNHPKIVDLAMKARLSKAGLPQDLASEFLDFVENELRECREN
ncbi:hypothetical protein BP00DRAFT_100059 [Aspergillus indologenus CBS 114.80]|uniref:Polymerase nucleotidyl transferase domain-containing protein n=1 Tax=Aspergillus indologenus CBS 114.80 TaxID=1450541 RepID=A0A2V5HNR2_9EURO|nr:hypothetical protein BP00DRAFT_100059 [Aspergillus indologenus CBS 114.80]